MSMRGVTLRAAQTLLLAAPLLGGATGCVSVPDDVRADLAPPDGQRPNNYGKQQGPQVVPDRPTIPADQRS